MGRIGFSFKSFNLLRPYSSRNNFNNTCPNISERFPLQIPLSMKFYLSIYILKRVQEDDFSLMLLNYSFFHWSLFDGMLFSFKFNIFGRFLSKRAHENPGLENIRDIAIETILSTKKHVFHIGL